MVHSTGIHGKDKGSEIRMCTALKYKTCMGRNYDYEQSYKETIVNIPRNNDGLNHAMIGVCTGFVEDYPLLYDGMNEYGLCTSALAFSGNAHYNKYINEKYNLPPYDFVHTILGMHRTVEEAQEYLEDTNIVNTQYNEQFPNSDLHWFICDKEQAITVEATKEGLNIYENNQNVLTNNPPYPKQAENCILQNSMIGTYPKPEGEYQTRGTETYGVLGDTTSMSRFQRVKHYKDVMEKAESPFNNIRETFHLLSTVEQTYGATPVNDSYEYTIYSVAYDMDNLQMAIKGYDSLYTKQYSINRTYGWRETL